MFQSVLHCFHFSMEIVRRDPFTCSSNACIIFVTGIGRSVCINAGFSLLRSSFSGHSSSCSSRIAPSQQKPSWDPSPLGSHNQSAVKGSAFNFLGGCRLTGRSIIRIPSTKTKGPQYRGPCFVLAVSCCEQFLLRPVHPRLAPRARCVQLCFASKPGGVIKPLRSSRSSQLACTPRNWRPQALFSQSGWAELSLVASMDCIVGFLGLLDE